MGYAKHVMMQEQAAQEEAISVLVEAGFLQVCEFHGNVFGDCWDDLTLAYKIANAKITKGEIALPDRFTRRDFTDLIQKQAHAQPESCWQCDKWRYED